MISLKELQQYVDTFSEELISDGVKRKYVTCFGDKIYLHPDDPRFGARLDGTLFSFRRPMGARGTEARASGVDYARPRILKGHKEYRGRLMITITPTDKRQKANFVCEIFHCRPSLKSKVGFNDSDNSNLSYDNLYWV